MRVAPARVGKRAFLGNSGMTAPGRSVPKHGLVAVLSATPRKAKKRARRGSAARRCGCAAAVERGDTSRTFHPPRHAQGGPRRCRAVPGRAGDVLRRARRARRRTLHGDPGRRRVRGGRGARGPLLLAAGVVAACVTTAAKWLLVGRIRPVRAPAVELVRVAQRAGRHLRRDGGRPVVRAARGAAPRVLNVWLRTLGAQHRARGVVRDVLAARGRPRPTRRRRDGQPGLRACRPTCSMIGS